MKYKILILLVAMTVSCGKLSDKAKDAVDSISGDAEKSGNIIAYSNAMIDYMNEAGEKMDRASGEFGQMKTMVTKKRKPSFFMPTAFIGSVPKIDRNRDGILLLKPGNNLPSEIKDKTVAAIKAASDALSNTKKAYEDLKEYYDNEDFKDDDWAKGIEYVDSIEKGITDFYAKRSEGYKIMRPFTDAAEMELLKDHPLKEVLIASKKDLGLAEEIVDMVYAEKVDIDALNAKYTELEESVKNNRVLTPDLLKEHDKERSYKSYYEQLDDFLGEVRKDKRDGKITEGEADDIGDELKYLIRDYNSFV